MASQNGDSAQIGETDFMHRRFPIAHQECVHFLTLEQFPLARRGFDIGGVDHDQRIGLFDRTSQRK